jgi:hypothetical protein
VVTTKSQAPVSSGNAIASAVAATKSTPEKTTSEGNNGVRTSNKDEIAAFRERVDKATTLKFTPAIQGAQQFAAEATYSAPRGSSGAVGVSSGQGMSGLSPKGGSSAAGIPFSFGGHSTEREAGLSVVGGYNVLSIVKDREFFGLLYLGSDGNVYSTPGIKGGRGGFDNPVGKSAKYVPKDATIVGLWHTHAAYDRLIDNSRLGSGGVDYNQVMSPDDVTLSTSSSVLKKYGLSGQFRAHYLGTPSGQIFEYMPRAGDTPGTAVMTRIGWSGGGYGFRKPQ